MTIILIVPGGFDPSGRARVIPALLWLTTRLAQQHAVHVCVTDSPRGPRTYRLAGAMVHELGPLYPQIAPIKGRIGTFYPQMTQMTQIRDWIERAVPRASRAMYLPGQRMAQLWDQLLAVVRPLVRAGPLTAVHGFWAGTSGVLAGLLARRLGVPAVLSIGGGELVWLPEIGYGGQGRWRSRVQAALALRLADVVTAGSRFALGPLAGRFNPRWVPLGVETALFAGPPERADGPPWRLIHIASINRVKDQETLLQALRLIANALPAVRLDWVGEDTLAEALHRRVAALGLADHVRFHGFEPTEQLVARYHQAHLHLMTSRFESQAVVVSEAAAAGVPTVGTAVGILPELAPQAAVTVPVGDAPALARAVLALLADPARRVALGAAAQTWARQHDAAWTARQFQQIYREARDA